MEIQVITEPAVPKVIKEKIESTENPPIIQIIIKEKEVKCQIISGDVNYII